MRILAQRSETGHQLVRHEHCHGFCKPDDRVGAKYFTQIICTYLPHRDLNKLQEGIGEKLGMLTFYSGTFFFSMVVAFVYGWDLTLVILSMLPLMSVFGALAAKVQTSFAQKEMEAYGQAGVIAEEVLSAVRTVVAFGGEKKEVARYEEKLEGARSKGVQRGMLTGLGGGLSFGTMFAMYGLGFWYGIKCIMDDREGEACQSCDVSSEDYLVCAEECQRYATF